MAIFKLFSKELPTKFRFLNALILAPSLLWPGAFILSGFIFDNPGNMTKAYITLGIFITYPLFLLIIAELNARLYLRNKKLACIIPSIIIVIFLAFYIYINMF